jgi:ABC-type phosphate transport system substrate-binding protein
MRILSVAALSSTLLVFALCAIALAQSRPAPFYVVIIQTTNPAASVERKFLEDAFLKKITRWPDDATIRPVDLAASSPIRRRFSEEVLERTLESVKSYWQQRIFSGRDVPPPELDTDDDVVAYVRKHDGAVGYVSGRADVSGVKILAIR